MQSNAWTEDARTVVAVERLDCLAELAAIGRELSVLEAQFGARPEIQAARCWQQRLCMDLLTQLIASLLASHTETRH